MRERCMVRVLGITLVGVALGWGPSVRAECRATEAGATIELTTVPQRGAGPERMEPIAGRVEGVQGDDCRVVVYAKTDTWYVQPTVAEPYTDIGKDGTWETDTHLGYEYAALLVDRSHKPAPKTASLPGPGAGVLASSRRRASQP